MSSHNVQLAFGSAILALLIVGAGSYRVMALCGKSDRLGRHATDYRIELNIGRIFPCFFSIKEINQARPMEELK